MRAISNVLHNRIPGTFNTINVDRELLCRIVSDMIQNGGILSPILHWQIIDKTEKEKNNGTVYCDNISVSRYDEVFESMYCSAEQFLDAWIGCIGCQPWNEQNLKTWLPFLTKCDFLKLYEYMNSHHNGDWLYTDLGTVIDLNILHTFCKDEMTYILEIGGGYGRVTEAVMNVFADVKYVMVDAVPGSLIFAYAYLTKELPNKNIGFYYNGDPFDMDMYDVYICPSWHFEHINNRKYDFAINLSSFQEMSQHHVDYYLSLFNSLLVEGGIVYLHNSRDYIFKGIWNYPDNWRKIAMFNTPKSWSDVFPLEVFCCESLSSNFSKENALIDAGYFYEVSLAKSQKGT